MSSNILDSYLVRLGAVVDGTSWSRFNYTLRDAEKKVFSFTGVSVLNLLKVEATIVSMLSAAGSGIIALADKTAMADQQYRLFGMRMLMTKDSARAMKLSMDELGASIDEIAYDPELNSRFQYLYQQNLRLGKALGKNFDQDTIKMRDVRMEFNLLTKAAETLGQSVVTKLFEKLGFGSGNLENQLHSLNEWFIDNIPAIGDKLSTFLIPIWDNWVVVAKDLGRTIKLLVGDVQLFTGILSGDRSIQTTQISMESLAVSTLHWVDGLTEAALSLQIIGKMTGRFGAGAGYGIESLIERIKGNKTEADRLNDMSRELITGMVSDVTDLFDPGKNGKNLRLNPDLAGIVDFEDHRAQRGARSVAPDNDITNIITSTARKYHLDPNLLSALIHQESHYNPGLISPKGAEGLTQLMPGTSKFYGIKNPFDPVQNAEGGAHLLSDLLKRYNGDISLALAAYNAGPGAVSKYGGIPPYHETQDYVRNIMRNYSKYSQLSSQEGGSVHIDSVTIQVPKHLPEEKWSGFVRDSMKDILDTDNRNVMAQTAGGAFH